ncbi:DNA cytosine methyltransferase [Acidovorax sp. JG5]|uniref:DNA cytosine methyltransferase n=1 Tax=Acidovorax sp. JG5 TaxID=2822718 RepID=UPI001B32191D|nr:DNA cytosine methyltransferase [Acidovorax sp. JG5]MBP3980829.1 DNA cytosine methyltransferase [Acidovorax sp. JG5]
MKAIDLFAGAGGFSTGAMMAGCEVVWAANHWPAAVAVHAVLDDYQTALEALPARTMVRCHRMTEKRIREIFGRIDHLPDGVHVMAV